MVRYGTAIESTSPAPGGTLRRPSLGEQGGRSVGGLRGLVEEREGESVRKVREARKGKGRH